MNKLCMMFFIITLNLSAQWYFVNPRPDFVGKTGIFFFNQLDGWLVGYAGGVYKTTDGGINWEKKFINTSMEIYSVFFIDRMTGWVSGNWGSIYRTTDGGETWVGQATGLTQWITKVYFLNSEIGFAVGSAGTNAGYWGVMTKTTNGGVTWSKYNFPTLPPMLNTITFVDSTTGFIAGYNGYVSKTTDGGITWKQTNGTGFNIKDVQMINKNKIIAVGDYGLASLNVNGVNWINIAAPKQGFKSSVHFTDSLYGWINMKYNDNGDNVAAVLKTIDGGVSWTFINTKFEIGYEAGDIFFADREHGWLLASAGFMLQTSDGGLNWVNYSPTNESIYDIFFIGDTGWCTSREYIIKTTNHGLSWTKKKVTAENDVMYQVRFADNLNGWAIDLETIRKTTDGGNSWVEQYSQQHDLGGNVCAIDKNYCLSFFGNSWLKTTDGGTTWYNLPVAVSSYNNSICALDTSIYFYGGTTSDSEGKVLKTTNGGSSWVSILNIDTLPPRNINTVFFIDKLNGIAAGYREIFRTYDGGINWKRYVAPSMDSFIRVWCVDSAECYAMSGQQIYKSTDACNTWQATRFFQQGGSSLWGMMFTKTGDGWMSSSLGGILHTKKLIFTEVEKNELFISNLDYQLFQNYPNPPNPLTKIKYKIIRSHNYSSGHVLLRLFDILGNRIATLVDEEKAPGEYEVVFNTATVASGVYFYQIISGNYTETKKMIVVK